MELVDVTSLTEGSRFTVDVSFWPNIPGAKKGTPKCVRARSAG